MHHEKILCTNLHKPVIDVELDVLLLVLLCHHDVAAAGLQLPHLQDAKALVLNSECVVNDVCDVIFPRMETCI